jgi:hypothetical protein
MQGQDHLELSTQTECSSTTAASMIPFNSRNFTQISASARLIPGATKAAGRISRGQLMKKKLLCAAMALSFCGGSVMRRTMIALAIVPLGALLAACVSTSMQGYADLQPPEHPIQHIAAFAAPPLIPALATQASRYGIVLEDAKTVLPPTREYKEVEIRQAMASHGIDAVLVVNANDSGVRTRYAGTIASANYTGTSSGNAMVMGNTIYGSGISSGTVTATSIPVYGYSRTVTFQAQLSDPQTSRKFWVGGGQTQAGGSLFMGDGASATSAASSIFNDLSAKGLIVANKV